MAAASTACTRLSRSERDVTSSGGAAGWPGPPDEVAGTSDRSVAGGMVHTKQPRPAGRRGGAASAGTLRAHRERAVHHERRRVVADDDASAVAPGQIAPGQVEQRGDAVAVAEQGDQVQREPGEPGE